MMWSTRYDLETALSAEALWQTWLRVLSGDLLLPGGDRYEPLGGLGHGAQLRMTPAGQEPVVITITRWEPPHCQADRVEYGGVELVFTHSFDETASGSRITLGLEIQGAEADRVGPQLGPQIGADFPATAQSLVEAATLGR